MFKDLAEGPRRLLATVAVVAVVLLWTAMLAVRDHDSEGINEPLGWVLLGVACVAIFWRHALPFPSAIVVSLCTMGYYPMSSIDGPLLGLFLLSLYTLASTSGVRWAVGLAFAAFFGTLLPQLTSGFRWVSEAELLLLSGWYAAAVAIGAVTQHYRAYQAESEIALNEAERRSVAEERLRIARELHDAVGHHLSLINVQATAAGRKLKRNPQYSTSETLSIISETSQLSLRELRSMVGVLREAGQDSPTGPGPSLDQLPSLTAAAEAAGLEVVLREDGSAELPAAVDAAAYRVVQEALTNVLRHAQAERVVVNVVIGTSTLAVRVADDGKAFKGGKWLAGNGLTGMRERAESLGGTFDAGPREDGGFVVEATWPLEVQS